MTMQRLLYSFSSRQDTPKALADSLSFFGSLRASREVWASLLRCLGWEPRQMYYMRPQGYLDDGTNGQAVATDIVTRCCPVEGDPHPQRAFAECGEWMCRFVTPGRVEVFLQVVEDKEEPVLLSIQFNRSSQFAATCIVARLYESLGAPKDGQNLEQMLKDAISDRDGEQEEEDEIAEVTQQEQFIAVWGNGATAVEAGILGVYPTRTQAETVVDAFLASNENPTVGAWVSSD